MKDQPTRFVVVYEDLWHNKYHTITTKIGTAIKEIIKDNDLVHDYDEEFLNKLDSDNPYQAGTFGQGFYDLEFMDEDDEYAGRVMIFDIYEEVNEIE